MGVRRHVDEDDASSISGDTEASEEFSDPEQYSDEEFPLAKRVWDARAAHEAEEWLPDREEFQRVNVNYADMYAHLESIDKKTIFRRGAFLTRVFHFILGKFKTSSDRHRYFLLQIDSDTWKVVGKQRETPRILAFSIYCFFRLQQRNDALNKQAQLASNEEVYKTWQVYYNDYIFREWVQVAQALQPNVMSELILEANGRFTPQTVQDPNGEKALAALLDPEQVNVQTYKISDTEIYVCLRTSNNKNYILFHIKAAVVKSAFGGHILEKVTQDRYAFAKFLSFFLKGASQEAMPRIRTEIHNAQKNFQ